MKFINEIINFFKNITMENLIDLAIGIIIILVFKILSSSLAYIILKMFHIKKNKREIKKHGFYKPLKTFFVVLGIYIGFISFKLPANYEAVINKLFRISIIILVAKGFANLLNPKSNAFSKIKEKLHTNNTDTSINFFSKIATGLIYIIAGFIVISEFGYDLSGLVTGLGISGVVIALAAQDVAKSILAGLSIISDRPFDIGDYIEVGPHAGTVENITFRTTRLRNKDNQIVVLPNSLLTTSSIINCSKIEKRKYTNTLTLALNTPQNTIKALTQNIKDMLENNSNILPDSILVCFDTISKNGINLSISFDTNILDTNDFLDFKEKLNYLLLEMLNNLNVSLA